MLFEHYHCQKVWTKETHNTRVSGAVWFKHKYLTNPSVTLEDQIVAAIGGIAKTLTTDIPPQLRDNTVDELRKLQDILQPKLTSKANALSQHPHSKGELDRSGPPDAAGDCKTALEAKNLSNANDTHGYRRHSVRATHCSRNQGDKEQC